MEPKDIRVAAMPQTAVHVITRPADFFQQMSKTGGYVEPLVFAVVMGLISGVIYAVLGLFGLGQVGLSNRLAQALSMIVLMPIAAAIGSFIGGAVLFVIWKLMGSTEDYEASYRCGAYLMALAPVTAVISAVPYAGTVVNAAIMLFYLVTASVYVHRLDARKAWLVFGVIAAVFALLGVYSQYRARHVSTEVEKWRQMGEDLKKEYGKSAEEMQKSADELRKQAEEMARQYRQQLEEQRRKQPSE
jgi:hypothetical protein